MPHHQDYITPEIVFRTEDSNFLLALPVAEVTLSKKAEAIEL